MHGTGGAYDSRDRLGDWADAAALKPNMAFGWGAVVWCLGKAGARLSVERNRSYK
ncbi:hypothetical protein FHY12_001846 [Xanthomonas arboricola]|nr:hypothetical protein [Xanthomonas euroxanthea]